MFMIRRMLTVYEVGRDVPKMKRQLHSKRRYLSLLGDCEGTHGGFGRLKVLDFVTIDSKTSTLYFFDVWVL